MDFFSFIWQKNVKIIFDCFFLLGNFILCTGKLIKLRWCQNRTKFSKMPILPLVWNEVSQNLWNVNKMFEKKKGKTNLKDWSEKLSCPFPCGTIKFKFKCFNFRKSSSIGFFIKIISYFFILKKIMSFCYIK